MIQKIRILYILSDDTGFTKYDEKIFRSFASVQRMHYKKIVHYINYHLIRHMFWADFIVIWFASKHAIPAVLLNYIFNKPLTIIAGGWDVANVPEIRYGAMRGGSRTIIGRWILKNANKIIAVSKSNRREIINNGKVPINRVKLIYNAVQDINPTLKRNKKNQVIQ